VNRTPFLKQPFYPAIRVQTNFDENEISGLGASGNNTLYGNGGDDTAILSGGDDHSRCQRGLRLC